MAKRKPVTPLPDSSDLKPTIDKVLVSPPSPPPADDGLSALPPPPVSDDGLSPPPPLVPDRADQAMADAASQLDASESDIDGLLAMVLGEIEPPLGESDAMLSSLLDELIGATDVRLGTSGEALGKWINGQFKSTAKVLTQSSMDMMRANIAVPGTTEEMIQHLEGDFLQMVATAIPLIGAATGTKPHSAYYRVGGIEPPEPVPVPPVPIDQCDPDELRRYEEMIAYPVPIGVPRPIGGGGTTGGSSEADCCPPQTINISINGVPASPVAPPPGGGSTSPGTVNYNWRGGDVFSPSTTSTQYLSAPSPPTPSPPTPSPPTPIEEEVAKKVAATTPTPLMLPVADELKGTYESSMNWNSISDCAWATRMVKMLDGGQTQKREVVDRGALPAYVDSTYGFGVWDLIQRNTGIKKEQVTQWMVDFAKSADATVQSIMSSVNDVATTALLSTITPQNAPNLNYAIWAAPKIAAAAAAEANTHLPMTYLTQGDMYLFQFANPQFLPNQIRVDSAYLSGQIDDATWNCWTRANGNLPEPMRRVMLSDQLKPSLMELIALFRRGKLTSKELIERCRTVGVINAQHIPEWLTVTQQLPTQSDLIRFMVRDAADERVVTKYGYDTGFKEKYTGQMERFAIALGLDETYFRYSWRSHWEIPSYTQLTEMLARLRPDRLEVKEWEAAGGADQVAGLGGVVPPKPLSVTRDDVREALQINDMAPGWVDRLIEVSYNPINRTDAIRAYMTGAFTDDQLYDSFLNTRYSPRDAAMMLAFYRRDKARRQRNISGVWSIRKVIKYYKDKVITRDNVLALLGPILPNRKEVDAVIAAADQEMAADVRRIGLKALRRGFMFGEHSPSDVAFLAGRWGVESEQAEKLVQQWTIERDGRLRQPTVSQITKWLRDGIISVEDARSRLANLAYALADVDRIIAAALKMEFGDDPPSVEELGSAIETVISNQRKARQGSDGMLTRRLRQIMAEAARIEREINRRRDDAGLDPLPAVVPP